MIQQLGGVQYFMAGTILFLIPPPLLFSSRISKKWIIIPKFEYTLNIFDLICGRDPDLSSPPPTHNPLSVAVGIFILDIFFIFHDTW